VDATLACVGNQLEQRGVQTCRIVGKEGDVATTSPVAPAEFSLGENFPNPFNPSTTISFQVPSPSVVSLEIYNIIGQKVRTLIDGMTYQDGEWEVVWDGRNDDGLAIPSGTYISRLTTPAGMFTRKMQLIQ
jgi:flagellar hook assembly protein FlgD